MAEEKMTELDLIRAQLRATWPALLEEIVNNPDFADIPQATVWLDHVLQNNVPFGKGARGTAVVLFYREFRPIRTAEEDANIYILAWCIEIVSHIALLFLFNIQLH
jgi:hypothetical protein